MVLLKNIEKRNLQLEAFAHIEVQRLIDNNFLEDTHLGTVAKGASIISADYLSLIHRHFYERLPKELQWVEDPKTKKKLKVNPGKFRQRDVQVGSHVGTVVKRASSRLRRTNDRSALGVHEDHEDDENAEIGVSLHAQDIFLLFKGGLATGKTTTISMLIKALGVNSESSSPTFMGMHEYSFKNIQLYHLDLYQKNIDLDSVLELMDSDSPQIWMIERSEKLDQEILDYLYLKHAYIKTFDVELKILEDDIRSLSLRETFKEFRDSNEKENDENIENEVLKWSEQELN